jgi:Flp pilus assembly pilin Flp
MVERFNLWAIGLIGRSQVARQEEGQALVEYALILALISVVAVLALRLVGQNVTTLLTKVSNDF